MKPVFHTDSFGTSHGVAAANKFRPAGFGMRVLLVEDEPANAGMAESVLEDQGCQVIIAQDGAQAVEAALHGSFDVILMDVCMPVMNGFECTRRIKRAERDIGRRHTPIVGVTGRAMPSELELCFEAGMDDVLVKPYLISDLWEVVVRWCRRAACDSGTF